MKNNNQCKCSQRLSVLLYNTITLLLEEGMTVEELKKEIGITEEEYERIMEE